MSDFDTFTNAMTKKKEPEIPKQVKTEKKKKSFLNKAKSLFALDE